MKRFSQIPGWRVTVTILALALAQAQGTAQVVLNELMADNRSAVGHAGRFPDYIELHNLTAASVDLAGWSLSDDPLDPRAFVFPTGTTIAPNGFLVVWADSEFGATGFHTGFGLGARGDQVTLYAADGLTVLDHLGFGLQTGDYSIGRVPDGSGAWVLNQPSLAGANTAAALGADSQLRLNEWMARPSSGEDWLEVFNADTLPVALGGLVITDQPSGTPGNRAIPQLSFIGGRGHVQFFASDLEETDADHLDFRLSASGETLTIYGTDRVTVLDRVIYGEQADNVSQGRAPDGGDTIVSFPAGAATPGASNFRELTNVVISELLSHTDSPLEDAIELSNLTDLPVDISHWWLSDSASQPRKYRIPAGTQIAARGYAVFYHYQFGAGVTGFGLDAMEGEEVYLSAGDAAGELTGDQTMVRFGALTNGISAGRYATSTGVDFVPLSARSFGVDTPATVVHFRTGTGASNAAPRIGPVVINEIMFQPAGSAEEFVELHNPTAMEAPLFDPLHPTNTWRLRDGVTLDLPGISIPPGGFLLLVSFDPVSSPAQESAFRALYQVPAGVPIAGPYTGSLNDTGEALELRLPDVPEGMLSETPGFVPYMQVERIRYMSVAPWPATAAGTGSSLQRRQPLDYGNEPLNWIAAAPTAGRPNLIDSDGDRMPDAWETEYNLDPHSPLDALEDADGDRMSNVFEFLSGTNPRDAESVLAFTRVERDGDVVRGRFRAVEGREYSLDASEFLGEGTWLPRTNFPAAPATGELEFEIQVPQDAAFFRLSTPVVP